jgi:DNA invertase Pin-like site-specific DNA recombinase
MTAATPLRHGVRTLCCMKPQRVIGYLRVSTQEQATSGLGLEAQRARIEEEATRRHWQVEWIVDDGYTAASLARPGITNALGLLDTAAGGRQEGPVALVVAKLDRLSRSLLDFAGLTERAQKSGWAIVALDLGVDMTTPQGQLLANVMASFAAYERELIRQRTRDALQALRSRGVRLGRPVAVSGRVRASVAAWRASGCTLAAIAAYLNAEGVPTAQGGARWYPSTVAAVLRSMALDEEVRTSSVRMLERSNV